MQCLVVQPLFTSPSDLAICYTSAVVFWCQPSCKQPCIDQIPSSSRAASLRKPSSVVPSVLLLGRVSTAFSSESGWQITRLLVAHIHSCQSIHSPEIPTALLLVALLQRTKVEAFRTCVGMTDWGIRNWISCTFHWHLLYSKQKEPFDILGEGHF